jgi:hypothetical protein
MKLRVAFQRDFHRRYQMPSLSDVANDIKNTLNDIKANSQQTNIVAGQIKGDTGTIVNELNAINATLNNGFNTLAQGLFAVFEAEKEANSLLIINAEQNQTIICWLSTIADLLCRELRKMNSIIDIETRTRDAVITTESLLELVHAREAVEVERAAQLEAEIRKCCPPPEPQPEFCFEPCKLRETPVYKPQGQDWKPRQHESPR